MEPRIRLEDFASHVSLSGLKCPAHGHRAAFVTSQCSLTENAYRWELWLYSPEGLRRAEVPSGFTFYEWENGETLLLGWKQPGRTVLRRLNAVTGALEEAGALPFAANSALPLPGGLLAVTETVDRNAGDPGIHQDFEIFEELPLRQNAGGYTSGLRHELSVCDPATGEKTKVAGDPFDVEQVQRTPDGTSLIYSGRAYRDMRMLDHAIHRYCLTDGSRQEILSQKDVMFLGYFACDNEGVTYSATDCKPYGFGQIKNLYRFDFASGKGRELYRCQRNTGLSEVIADGRRGALSQFCIRNGRLWFGSTWGYENHAFSLKEGEEPREELHMDGSVDALTVLDDGTMLVIAHRGQRLQELYRVEKGCALQVSEFNEAFYRKARPVKPRHFTYENDGVELDGWVLLPEHFDEHRQYPAILDIHGGPRLVYGEIYFHEMQAWCAQDYVVMYCNPRGGSGKGNEFSNLWSPRTLGDWDFRDVMAFVDEVLRRYPNVDPKRVAVTGGSYGGFLTNWIIGHTSRFAAAASQRSIASWFDCTLISDNGYYDWDRIADEDPWKDIAEMWRVSPIHYAPDCTTPTLFLQSFEDYRCPFGEGLQMFTALKMHRVPTRMCAFYNENHELSRNGKPRNRLKRLQEMTAWFDRWLRAETEVSKR